MSDSGLFSVAGKSAVVTGGSSGIGRFIAEELLKAGAAPVYICARRRQQLQATVRELATLGDCAGVSCDVSTTAGVEELAAAVERRQDRLQILVNNAAVVFRRPIDQYPVEEFDRALTLNTRAPFQIVQRLLPLLRAAASANDPARVINIGSVGGIEVSSFPSFGYSASKAGLHLLSRHLAHVLARDHITVNVVAPGAFETPMSTWTANQRDRQAKLKSIPLGRPGDSADIGGAVIYLSSRAGAYVTGAVIPVSGGVGTLASATSWVPPE